MLFPFEYSLFQKGREQVLSRPPGMSRGWNGMAARQG